MHLLINSAIWFAVIDFLSYSAIGHERKWHMIKPKRNKEEILKTEQLSPNALISRWRRQLIVQSKNQLPVQIKSRHQPVRLLSRKSHKVKDSEFHQEEENEKIWQPSIRLVYRGRVSKNRFNDEVQKQGLLNSTTYSLVPVEPDAEIAHTVSQDVQSSILESNFTPNPLILSNKNADVRTVGSSNYSKSFGYSSAVSVKPLQGGSVKFHPQVKEKFMHDASDLVTLDLKYDVNQKNIRHKRTTPSSSDSDSSFRNRLQKVLQNIESGERTIKETFKTALSSLISNASNVMNGTSMETEGSQIYDAEQMKNTITDGQLVSSSNIPFTTSITPANEYVASTSDAIPDTTLQIQIKKTDHPSSSLGIGDFDEFYSSETHPEVVSAYAKIDDVDSHSVSKNSEFTSSNVFSVIDGEYYYPGVTSEMNMDYHSFTSDAESTTSDMTSIPIVDAEGSSSTNTQLPVVLDRLSTLNAEFPYNTENIKLPKARPHTTQVPVLELADNITNKQAWTTEQLPSSDEDLSLGNNSYSLLEEITTVIPVAVRSEADSDSDQGELVTDPYSYVVQTPDYPSLLLDTRGNLSSVYKVFKKFVENLSSDIYTEGPLENLVKEKSLTMSEVMKILWSGTRQKDKLSQEVLGEDPKFYPNSSESLGTSENPVVQSKSTSEYELNGLFHYTKSDHDVPKNFITENTPMYTDKNVHNHLLEDKLSVVINDSSLLKVNQTPFLVTMPVTETQTVDTSVSDSGDVYDSQPFNWFLKLKALMNETYPETQYQHSTFSPPVTETQTVNTSVSDSGYVYDSQLFNWFLKLKALMNETNSETQYQDSTFSPQSSARPSTTTLVPVTSSSGNTSYFDRFVNFIGVTKSVSEDNKEDMLDADHEREALLNSKISDDKQAKESRTKQSEYYLKGDVTEKVDTNPEYLSSYNEIESEEIDVITAFPTPAPKNETEDDSTGTVPVVFPFSTEIYSEIQNTSFNNRSLDAVIAILKPQVNEASTRDPVNEEREPLFEVRSFETHDNDSLDDLAFTSVLNESLDDTTTSIIYLPVHVQQNSSSGNKSITDVMAIIKHEAQPSMERTSNSFNNGSNDSGSVSLFTPEIFSNSSTNETIIVAHSDVFTPESVSFTPESVSFTPESISFTPESVSSTPEGSTSSSNKSMAEVMAILKPFNVSEISTLFPDSTISVYSTTAIPIYSDFPTSVESNTESLVKAPEALPEISTLQIGTLIYSENTSTTVDSVSESSSLAVFVPPLTAVPSTSSVANHEQMSTTTDIMILMHENLPTDWMSSAITEDYHSSSSSESSTIASVTETSINILLPEEVVTSTLLVDTPYPVSEIILSHDPLPETTVTSTTSGSAETDEIEQTVDLISTDPHNHTVVAISSAAAVIGLIIGFVGIALVRKAVKDRKKVYFIQPRSFRHH
ncbi:serine-rich adhesin for platelets-like isoform X2 [Palaemon carinicauda]|uniref:serine-rich adhesin for platelets-like isoform X2 n=1 Tax=Palaemon carinicauda TaxID=392227 RepID=UPI0035B63E49